MIEGRRDGWKEEWRDDGGKEVWRDDRGKKGWMEGGMIEGREMER